MHPHDIINAFINLACWVLCMCGRTKTPAYAEIRQCSLRETMQNVRRTSSQLDASRLCKLIEAFGVNAEHIKQAANPVAPFRQEANRPRGVHECAF